MISTVEIKNETSTKVSGTEELFQDFLSQLNFQDDCEISILYCDNDKIQQLNRDFRKKDYATDVLSFPSEMDYFLGDIAISLEKAKEQATGTFEDEVEMLLCHGLLHLMGYDHENSEEDYEEMMGLQQKLLANKTKGIKLK